MKDEAVCALWLKRVQTRPADFCAPASITTRGAAGGQSLGSRAMRRMVLMLVFACLGAPAGAQDVTKPEVVVRQSVDPATGAVIGQHVALRVEVLFRDTMPHPPRVTLPDVAGIQALRLRRRPHPSRDDRRRGLCRPALRVRPLRPPGGSFEIRPARVALLDREGNVIGTAEGQALSLSVAVPPGVDPLRDRWSRRARSPWKKSASRSRPAPSRWETPSCEP